MSEVDKQTPYKDTTWYVKWAATVLMIVAVSCRSVEEVPKIVDQVVSLFGLTGWFWVAWVWHDRALMVVNAIALPIIIGGIIRWLFLNL